MDCSGTRVSSATSGTRPDSAAGGGVMAESSAGTGVGGRRGEGRGIGTSARCVAPGFGLDSSSRITVAAVASMRSS